MISVEEAKNLLQQHQFSGRTGTVALDESLGLFLSADIQSPVDIPFFDNSAMDGYAIRWQDGQSKRKLRTETKIRAGEMESFTLGEDEAIMIFTGAPIPNGADTVIQQELVSIEGNLFSFDIEKFSKGANVRKKGAQNTAGTLIAKRGSEITPGMIGLLASVGLDQVPVYLPPTVGIILTGDELLEVGEPLSFGKVYDSNGHVLKTYLNKIGVKAIEMSKSIDDPELLQSQINDFIQRFDVLIISGGISVGDFDFVKKGLENAGVNELFYKIKQKPGKPLYVGFRDHQWIFALPGNPASTLTCFNQYVKPCLESWMGKLETWQPTGLLPLKEDFRKNQGLTFFLKAKEQNGSIEILKGQESFNLISYGSANCIAEIPEDIEFLPKGSMVKFYKW